MSSTSVTNVPELDRAPATWVWGGLVLWVVAACGGWASLTRYSFLPGMAATAPSALATEPDSTQPYQLFVFVHPRCPCSTATIRELSRMLATCGSGLRATVYFSRPESQTDDWAHGPLWDSAAGIPGIEPRIDAGGKTARRYGAFTSGDVLLYDPKGQLRYHGGITSARGHEGDSQGKLAILATVRGEATEVTECPVFGCAL